jgi:hypothetical protein
MKIPADFKADIVGSLEELTMDNIWKLRADVHVLKNYVSRYPGSENQELAKSIDDFLDVSLELYSFFADIQGAVSSADFNKLARLINVGGDAIFVTEEILSGEHLNLPDLINDGLHMVLSYMGSTAYIIGEVETVESEVTKHIMIAQDRLWYLVDEFKKDSSLDELKSMSTEMSNFFKSLGKESVPLADRITVITRIYQFLCIIHLLAFLNQIEWETPGEIQP